MSNHSIATMSWKKCQEKSDDAFRSMEMFLDQHSPRENKMRAKRQTIVKERTCIDASSTFASHDRHYQPIEIESEREARHLIRYRYETVKG